MGENIEAIRVLGFWGFIYHRFVYRHVMRFAHKHGWHYAPPSTMEDGSVLELCLWCGLHQVNSPRHRAAMDACIANLERDLLESAERE